MVIEVTVITDLLYYCPWIVICGQCCLDNVSDFFFKSDLTRQQQQHWVKNSYIWHFFKQLQFSLNFSTCNFKSCLLVYSSRLFEKQPWSSFNASLYITTHTVAKLQNNVWLMSFRKILNSFVNEIKMVCLESKIIHIYW